MSLTRPLWICFSLVLIALSTSNYYLYREVGLLKAQQVADAPLSENDVIMLVDQRLDALQLKKSKEALANLQTKYELAPGSTPDGKRIYGSNNARFTLQMFSDIECPICRKMHSGMKQVVDHSQGSVNWEFKHFPLAMHNPVAAVEAQAVECVAESYDNRHAWISLEQFILSTKGNGQGLEDIVSKARSFGLNGGLLARCLNSDSHKDKINKDYEEGRRLGITGTPAVRIIDNVSKRELLIKGYRAPEQLLQAIQELI